MGEVELKIIAILELIRIDDYERYCKTRESLLTGAQWDQLILAVYDKLEEDQNGSLC